MVFVVVEDLDQPREPQRLALSGTAWEIARAEAMDNPEHARRYLASRSLLRDLCALVLDQEPQSIEFARDPSGRLIVAGAAIQFSVARRDRFCAVAVGTDEPLGVDLEIARSGLEVEDLVRHFFPDAAKAELSAASEAHWPRLFAAWWARIEAASKACGSTFDHAVASLSAAPQVTREITPAVVAAVAVRGECPATIDWYLPGEQFVGPSWARLGA